MKSFLKRSTRMQLVSMLAAMSKRICRILIEESQLCRSRWKLL